MPVPDPALLAIGMVSAVCIGLSKTGFSGVSLVAVALLADAHGAKASVGLALPLLIAADLMAVRAFTGHGSWAAVWRLMPPTLAGIAAGWWLLGTVDDVVARRIIGGCVAVMVCLQVLRRVTPALFARLAASRGFTVAAGSAGGLATMMANAAGPVIQLYLLARSLPKMELLGVAAKFFLLVNLLKVPLNAQLELITPASLWHNLWLLPGVVIGVVGGRRIVGHVPQRLFEWLILGFAVLAALRLLVFT